jgi:hypothetical protein
VFEMKVATLFAVPNKSKENFGSAKAANMVCGLRILCGVIVNTRAGHCSALTEH